MFVGKDGGYYKTYEEARAANTRYDQQEKQIKLIEKQNNLIEKQNQINKEQKDKEIIAQIAKQQIQIEHEEKMRMNKLFDDIGLPKETYDEFFNFLFVNNDLFNVIQNIDEVKDKLTEQLERIDSRIELLTAKGTDEEMILSLELLYELENYNDDNSNSLNIKPIGKKELPVEKEDEFDTWVDDNIESSYKYFINNKKGKIKYEKELKDIGIYNGLISTVYSYNLDHPISKKSQKSDIIKAVICFALAFLMLPILEEIGDGTGFLVLVGVGIYCSIRATSDIEKRELKKINKLERIKELRESGLKNLTTIWNYKKEDRNIKEEVKEIIKVLEMNKQSLNDIYGINGNGILNQVEIKVKPRWDNFIEFRKKHYNSSIEKILIDTKLKEMILKSGLEYPKININNKLGDGTIDDYIAYFDEIVLTDK